MLKNETKRVLKYVSIGVGTFLLDLLLLYFFVEYVNIWEVFAAAISFAIAVTVNYILSCNIVFVETKQGVLRGYWMFLGIALIGVVLVSALMYVAVDVFGFNYLYARVVIAGIVGICTYAANFFLNFKIHEHTNYLKK